jgi:hypothetical protein
MVANKTIARIRTVVSKARGENLSSGHAVERIINLSAFSPGHAAFIKGLYDRYLEYVPNSYSGRVLVFVAKTQALMRLRQVKAAWRKIAPSSEILEVNGTHVNTMQMPRGLPIAKRLSKKIEEISEQTRPNCF